MYVERARQLRDERLRNAAATKDFGVFHSHYPGLSDRLRLGAFAFDEDMCEGLYEFAKHRATALHQYGAPARMYMRDAEQRLLQDNHSVQAEADRLRCILYEAPPAPLQPEAFRAYLPVSEGPMVVEESILV